MARFLDEKQVPGSWQHKTRQNVEKIVNSHSLSSTVHRDAWHAVCRGHEVHGNCEDRDELSRITYKTNQYLNCNGLVVFETAQAVFRFQGIAVGILRRVECGRR